MITRVIKDRHRDLREAAVPSLLRGNKSSESRHHVTKKCWISSKDQHYKRRRTGKARMISDCWHPSRVEGNGLAREPHRFHLIPSCSLASGASNFFLFRPNNNAFRTINCSRDAIHEGRNPIGSHPTILFLING